MSGRRLNARLTALAITTVVALCAGLAVDAARAQDEPSSGRGMDAARVARDRDSLSVPADSLLMVGASVTPDTGTVGDRFVLTLSAVHDLDTALAFPKLVGEMLPFEVIDVVIYPTDEGPDGAVERRDVVITVFETGEHTIPELPFHAVMPGGDTAVVYTEPLDVVIHSVIPPADLEGQPRPRDIKPPVDLPRAWWPWVVAVLVAAAAALAWRFWRRWRTTRAERSVEEGPTPEERRLAAHVAALERLRLLRASRHLEENRIEPFYVELTDILRRYLGDRFSVPAIDRTTTELRPELTAAAIPEVDISWLTGLLERADLSKFARTAPSTDRALGDLGDVETFVERTRLRATTDDGHAARRGHAAGEEDDDVPVR